MGELVDLPIDSSCYTWHSLEFYRKSGRTLRRDPAGSSLSGEAKAASYWATFARAVSKDIRSLQRTRGWETCPRIVILTPAGTLQTRKLEKNTTGLPLLIGFCARKKKKKHGVEFVHGPLWLETPQCNGTFYLELILSRGGAIQEGDQAESRSGVFPWVLASSKQRSVFNHSCHVPVGLITQPTTIKRSLWDGCGQRREREIMPLSNPI